MSHEHAGHYAAKHAPGTSPNPHIAKLVKQSASEGRISCADAHAIVHQLNVSPAEVGVTIDLLEIRVSRCQLGLFGHGTKKKQISPALDVKPELQAAIEVACQNHQLSCIAAWNIAQQLGISKVEVASACEALQIKIADCQLGMFS